MGCFVLCGGVICSEFELFLSCFCVGLLVGVLNLVEGAFFTIHVLQGAIVLGRVVGRYHFGGDNRL